MEMTTRKVYDVLVVDLRGRLDSRAVGDAGDRIAAIAKDNNQRVLLNLDKLDYVSSSGLRAILLGAKLLQDKLGEMKICHARDPVKTVLQTAGFDSLIKTYETEREAISAFLG